MGFKKSRIGIEIQYLCASDFVNLRKGLPDVVFVECKHIFEEVRSIKEPQEIDLLAKAASATRKGAEAAFITCNIGDTEKKLADQMIINLIRQNADKLEFMVLATGKRTLLSHPIPDQTKLTAVDPLSQLYYVRAYQRATSLNARDFLLRLAYLHQDSIKYLQIDNGSEWGKTFVF